MSESDFDAAMEQQLELRRQAKCMVKNQYTLLSPVGVAARFPKWIVKTPSAALAQRARRQNLIRLKINQQYLYPHEQFLPNVEQPKLNPLIIFGYQNELACHLTNWDYLRWLCSPIITVLDEPSPGFNDAMERGDFEAARMAIKEATPSKEIVYQPLALAQTHQTHKFRQFLSSWLGRTP